eukprot:5015199-Amphidinium_carterae.5
MGEAHRRTRENLGRKDRRRSEVCSDPEGDADSTEDLPPGKHPQRVRLDRDAQEYTVVSPCNSLSTQTSADGLGLHYAIRWSSTGKGKDGKDKGHYLNKGKGKGDKSGWHNQSGKGGKGKSKDKSGNGRGQGKHQCGLNAEHFAGHCEKCGAWGHKQKLS